MRTIKRSVIARGLGERWLNRQSTEDFLGNENTLHEIIMEICHYVFAIECATPGVNPNERYGLWVIRICQYRFTVRNTRPTLLWDVDRVGRPCTCRDRSSLELLLHFAVNIKSLLKIKYTFLKSTKNT